MEENFVGGEIKLRKADTEDCSFLFDVRNEKSVRENSFFTDKIDHNEHSEWFKKALKSENKTIYIIENNGERVGFLRLEKILEINIAIDKSGRGNGFAEKALNEIEKCIDGKIMARIKNNNKKSLKLFKKAGYKAENIKDKHEILIK